MNISDLEKFNVSELGNDEALNTSGGGILSTLIRSAFTMLSEWVVGLFNEGLDIERS
jgi:hypothetical protein